MLRYVSIRYPGQRLSPDKEINGLSLCAVGRGTTIEFVETYAIKDDGFEFFGGSVNTKYLVSAFNDDDGFDTDMGWNGKNQFWFGIQAADKRNYGMELNSQINEIATASLLTPQADFKIYNMTLIGSGTGSTIVNGGRGAAMILRPYVGPKIYNSIFTDFNERAIELDTRNGVNAATSVTNGYAQFANNLWWGFVTGSGSGNVNNTATNLGRFTVATNYWTDTSLTNLIVNPQLTGISRTNVGTKLDPRPVSGSPALDAGNVRALPANAVRCGLRRRLRLGELGQRLDRARRVLRDLGGRRRHAGGTDRHRSRAHAEPAFARALGQWHQPRHLVRLGDGRELPAPVGLGAHRAGGVDERGRGRAGHGRRADLHPGHRGSGQRVLPRGRAVSVKTRRRLAAPSLPRSIGM